MKSQRRGSKALDVGAQLEALGASSESVKTSADRVYGVLVSLWKTTGARPLLVDVAARAGIRRGSLSGLLQQLLDDKRVLNPSYGVWVPVVEGN